MSMLLELLSSKLSETERGKAIRKKESRETKRISVIVALERVFNFCNMHLNLPGTTLNRKMLEVGKSFALGSLFYLRNNPDEEDVPLKLFLDESYEYVIFSLARIGIEKVGDFLQYVPYRTTAEARAKLRKAWNLSVGSRPHPVFLGLLVPRNRSEIYGNYSN